MLEEACQAACPTGVSKAMVMYNYPGMMSNFLFLFLITPLEWDGHPMWARHAPRCGFRSAGVDVVMWLQGLLCNRTYSDRYTQLASEHAGVFVNYSTVSLYLFSVL